MKDTYDKKIMTSVLLAISLMTILPTTNALALTQEENKQYYDFITKECTQTSWDKSVYEKDGVYYLLALLWF